MKTSGVNAPPTFGGGQRPRGPMGAQMGAMQPPQQQQGVPPMRTTPVPQGVPPPPPQKGGMFPGMRAPVPQQGGGGQMALIQALRGKMGQRPPMQPQAPGGAQIGPGMNPRMQRY